MKASVMNREQAIAKIKKCLQLTRSGNPTEAATALRQAQALMRAHGLDEQGVALASVAEATVRARFQPVLAWEANLAQLIAEAYGCDVITTSKSNETRLLRYWKFIGVNALPQIAGYAFEALSGQLVRARLAHMARQSRNCKPTTRTARGDAFALGWVRGVQALVERFASTERNVGLVVAYMVTTYPSLAAVKPKRRDEGKNVKDCFSRGVETGRKAELRHGIGGMPEQRRLA
jgi:hypothetical protein